MKTEIQVGPRQFLDLKNPKPEQIRVEYIARSLSTITRFRGVFGFYSVAQHSVLVARELRRQGADPVTVFWGLLHDAAEAYLADIPTPAKSMREFDRAAFAFDRIDRAIRSAFGVIWNDVDAALVKRADLNLLFWERDALTKINHWPHTSWGIENFHPGGTIENVQHNFRPWSPQEAEREFLLEFLTSIQTIRSF